MIMLRREWKVMDKGDGIFIVGLLYNPLVDVVRDGKVFVVIVGLSKVGVAMDCLEGVE